MANIPEMFAVILNSDLDIHQFRCWPTTNTVADELNHSVRPDPVLQRQLNPTMNSTYATAEAESSGPLSSF